MSYGSQLYADWCKYRDDNPGATMDEFVAMRRVRAESRQMARIQAATAEAEDDQATKTALLEHPVGRAAIERDRKRRLIATIDELSIPAARIFELRHAAGLLDSRLCWGVTGLWVTAGVKLVRQERAELVRAEILAGCHAALVPGRS